MSLLLVLVYCPLKIRSIIGLVVEFIVAIDEARVRFTDDALIFFLGFVPFALMIPDNYLLLLCKCSVRWRCNTVDIG